MESYPWTLVSKDQESYEYVAACYSRYADRRMVNILSRHLGQGGDVLDVLFIIPLRSTT